MKQLFIILLCASLSLNVQAQLSREVARQNKSITAGNFYSYPAPNEHNNVEIKGYKPFYISHFGRHGSRYHSSEKYYKKPFDLLHKAHEMKLLTPKGELLLEKMQLVYDDAKGRYGDLTPRGAREHKGIAHRMYDNYQEVFKTKNGLVPVVESRSTMVVRCVLSMAAFNEGLKEKNPDLIMIRESSERYLDYMFVRTGGRSQYKGAKAVCDSLKKAWLKPDRFLNSLISSPEFIKSNVRTKYHTMYDFFMVASILQDVDYLGLDMYDIFTEEELFQLWKCVNSYCYLTMGASKRFGDYMLDDVRPLLKNIIETAENVINGRHNAAATLRFAHDCSVIPLAALLEIKGASERLDIEGITDGWNVSEVTPMATNIQFVFYRNKKNDIKVRVLLNEKDAVLPLAGAPFYSWNEFSAFCRTKYIHQ